MNWRANLTMVSRSDRTYGFVSPAGRPRSSRACSLFQQVRVDEACTAHSLSPMRCGRAKAPSSCAPAGGINHFLWTRGIFQPSQYDHLLAHICLSTQLHQIGQCCSVRDNREITGDWVSQERKITWQKSEPADCREEIRVCSNKHVQSVYASSTTGRWNTLDLFHLVTDESFLKLHKQKLGVLPTSWEFMSL